MTKLNPAGSALVYSTYLGGIQYDVGIGIAVDASGSAYVTGYTRLERLPYHRGGVRHELQAAATTPSSRS